MPKTVTLFQKPPKEIFIIIYVEIYSNHTVNEYSPFQLQTQALHGVDLKKSLIFNVSLLYIK